MLSSQFKTDYEIIQYWYVFDNDYRFYIAKNLQSHFLVVREEGPYVQILEKYPTYDKASKYIKSNFLIRKKMTKYKK